jgi:hypothetical protein
MTDLWLFDEKANTVVVSLFVARAVASAAVTLRHGFGGPRVQ